MPRQKGKARKAATVPFVTRVVANDDEDDVNVEVSLDTTVGEMNVRRVRFSLSRFEVSMRKHHRRRDSRWFLPVQLLERSF